MNYKGYIYLILFPFEIKFIKLKYKETYLDLIFKKFKKIIGMK